MQITEHYVQAKISVDPAFTWRCPCIIRKINIIIYKVDFKYFQRTHKCGIRVLHYLKKEIDLNIMNGNTLWQEDIRDNIVNVRSALEV